MSDHLTDVERVILQNKGHLERLLIVIAGPSGVGKNTIIKELLANHASEMGRVRTYTTRPPRDNEVDGEQYHFVTPEQFRELARANRLLEASANNVDGHDVYGEGNAYSMPADLFESIPADKHLVIAEVDVVGARRLREHYPNCVTIFVTAPPLDLLRRIRKRPDETMNLRSLFQRMQTARDQIRAAREFDYVIYNRAGLVVRSVQAVEAIIQAERQRVRDGFDLEAILPPDAFDIDVEPAADSSTR